MKSEYFLAFKKENDNFRVFIYFILAFFPMIFIVSALHEIGHLIVALCFGWRIVDIHFNIFPFMIDLFSPSYIAIDISTSKSNLTMFVIFLMAGSTFNLILGYFFLLIYYKYNLPLFIEICLFVYSMVMIFESMSYLIWDLFYLRMGDWNWIANLYPAVIGIYIFAGFVNIILYIKKYNKMIEKVDE